MLLFRKVSHGVLPIRRDDERVLEEEVHCLIEQHLPKFFDDVLFVAHKPHLGGKQFDTLAFDRAAKVPVILEYKREKGPGVLDQIALYCAIMKEHKFEVMKLFESKLATKDLGKVDFDNPRIIVVAKQFTPEQVKILSQLKFSVQLFRYQLYSEGIIGLDEDSTAIRSGVSRGSPSGDGGGQPPYPISHYGMTTDVLKLYKALDRGIISLDTRVQPATRNKFFIGYRATGNYFCTVTPRVKSLHVCVKRHGPPGRIQGLGFKKVSPGHGGPMTHTFKISTRGQIVPALRAITGALHESV